MEHFLEGIAPVRHWYINPNEKSKKYISSLLSKLTKAYIFSNQTKVSSPTTYILW